MKRIYVELLFLDNCLLDFFLLCCCSRLSERCVRLSRVAAGAAIGGIYGMLAALLPPLRAIVCKLPAAAILCLLVSWASAFYVEQVAHRARPTDRSPRSWSS